MKNLFFSIAVPLVVLSISHAERTRGYITIFCAGDPDKPYPVVIFDCHGQFDTTYQNFFIKKFEVEDTVLNNLYLLIKQTGPSADYDLINPPIGIRAVINDRDTLFYLGFKTSVSKLFMQIKERFDGQQRQDVTSALDQLAARLAIPD